MARNYVNQKSMQELKELIAVVEKLRDPQKGCPWDLEQTHESLLPYLLEESYEFIDAVEKKNQDHMQEELGDVLLQVLLHAVIAQQAGRFDLEGVAKTLKDKLIERHPHVFQPSGAKIDSAEVAKNWAKIKGEKKKGVEYFISDKELHHPALRASAKIGKKTKKVGFDWEDYTQVVYKVEEEWQELKEELPPVAGQLEQRDKKKIAEELGDLLFSVSQLARHLDLDAEEVLRDANKKFLRRFQSMEDFVREEGRELSTISAPEWNEYWLRSKAKNKAP